MNKIKLLVGIALVCLVIPSFAQSRFGILGGSNISTSSASQSSLKPGFYIGGLYDIKLNDKWYVQPQLLFVMGGINTSTTNLKGDKYTIYFAELPILLSYNIPLKNNWNIRINAGWYLNCALFGRNSSHVLTEIKENGTTKYEFLRWNSNTYDIPNSQRFSHGLKLGISFEEKHLFYNLDGKYSLKKQQYYNKGYGYTLNLGLGYKF